MKWIFSLPFSVSLSVLFFEAPPSGGQAIDPSAYPSNDGFDYAILCAVLFHTLQSRHKAVQNFVDKAELQQVGIFFRTQFPYLGYFINKKVGNRKN